MPSTTALLKAAARYDQMGYSISDHDLTELLMDARGQGVACGNSWIPKGKKCSKDKAKSTPKEALKRTTEKGKARQKLRAEVENRKKSGTVPDTIPIPVIMAVQDVLRSEQIEKALSKLSPETQKYNEAWGVVPKSTPSTRSLEVIKQAKELSKKNGWDWDGIVKKVEKENGTGADLRGLEALKNRDEIAKRRQPQQEAFSAEMDKVGRERQAKQAAEVAAKKQAETLARNQEIAQREERDRISTQKIKGDITNTLNRLTPESIDIVMQVPKTKKAKREQMNSLMLVTGTRNEKLLEEALNEWRQGRSQK